MQYTGTITLHRKNETKTLKPSSEKCTEELIRAGKNMYIPQSTNLLIILNLLFYEFNMNKSGIHVCVGPSVIDHIQASISIGNDNIDVYEEVGHLDLQIMPIEMVVYELNSDKEFEGTVVEPIVYFCNHVWLPTSPIFIDIDFMYNIYHCTNGINAIVLYQHGERKIKLKNDLPYYKPRTNVKNAIEFCLDNCIVSVYEDGKIESTISDDKPLFEKLCIQDFTENGSWTYRCKSGIYSAFAVEDASEYYIYISG